jgi:hypothetical protein
MQDYEKGFIALAVMGALIALGKMLNSNEPITFVWLLGRHCRQRVVAGRALRCTLYRIFTRWRLPGLVPLGILGLNGVEAWLRKGD